MTTQTQTQHQQTKTLTRAGRQLPTQPRPNRVIAASAPITIIIAPQPQHTAVVTANTLSAYLENGCLLHPLCRHGFIERIELGYYHYERRTEWRTCALAAAYAGAFGAASVERPYLSYSMALWQLGQVLGYDLREMIVLGPTGRCQAVADEMMTLVDWDGWTRAGVAAWLKSLDL